MWVVEVSIEDDNPEVAGPYTEAQAKRVAKRIDDEAQMAQDAYGTCLHPYSITNANAYPLGRWDKFLTAAQKREVRADVRESERRIRERQED